MFSDLHRALNRLMRTEMSVFLSRLKMIYPPTHRYSNFDTEGSYADYVDLVCSIIHLCMTFGDTTEPNMR